MDDEELAHRFESARPRLRAIATRMLGSAADADDAVQETWLRLARSDAAQIDNFDAWCTTVVSRISLDMLRAPRATRERSWNIEPWRDEPVDPAPDLADLVARSDNVNVALLVVLDALTPAERIAFVLHDVFGQPFDEVARAVDRSPDAARQLASRARRRLREATVPDRADRRRGRALVEAWLTAAQDGDLAALLSLLHDDATLHADYGARTQELRGAAEIGAQAVLAARLAAHSTPVLIDGRPGVAASFGERIVSLMAFDIEDGRIVGLDVLADPDRLAGVALPQP
ncbi:sigma-70 family RNA polymerase sigma factor [Microbacterium sp. W4I20]|uniref:sigma-70 family RNA polymerase sigma factor n=1 Tax=Microbacterium sp. W4I20 TaxID=3042262 RepID=UPI00278524D8|nr:sigma-70 family RNA polymerase sigma factor [Microbacterium sp. W4I20]MDQ0727117.1 RNA polymerase sigma-70 factor (ECF subfamily) [Microbacterium sp. W4I20]